MKINTLERLQTVCVSTMLVMLAASPLHADETCMS